MDMLRGREPLRHPRPAGTPPTGMHKLLSRLPVVALVGVLLGTAHPAAATVVTCRADPIVVLSNHKVMHMTVAISADPRSVSTISYTVHVPAGTYAKHVTYTGGAFAGKEHVTLIADGMPATYDVATMVAGAATGAVTATTQIGGQRAAVSGSTQQQLDLVMHVN